MIWVAAALGVFFFLAWAGRQVRLKRWNEGPWIRRFRTVRSVFGICLMGAGLLMIARGLWPEGLGALVLAAIMSASVRFHILGGAAPRKPVAAAVYTTEEIKAYQLLGVPVGADRKAVKAAWKKLIVTAHPDQGGSAEKAGALNAARDLLLKRRG